MEQMGFLEREDSSKWPKGCNVLNMPVKCQQDNPLGFTLIMLIIYNIKTVTVAGHLLVSGRTSAKR